MHRPSSREPQYETAPINMRYAAPPERNADRRHEGDLRSIPKSWTILLGPIYSNRGQPDNEEHTPSNRVEELCKCNDGAIPGGSGTAGRRRRRARLRAPRHLPSAALSAAAHLGRAGSEGSRRKDRERVSDFPRSHACPKYHDEEGRRTKFELITKP